MESGQAGRIDKAIMDALEEGQLSVKMALQLAARDGKAPLALAKIRLWELARMGKVKIVLPSGGEARARLP